MLHSPRRGMAGTERAGLESATSGQPGVEGAHCEFDLLSGFAPASGSLFDSPGVDYLLIGIREARNISPIDHDTKSASTFARVRVGEKGGYLFEAETRTCYRTRFPYYGQGFYVPMKGLSPQTRICIDVKDVKGKFTTFCGQVQCQQSNTWSP